MYDSDDVKEGFISAVLAPVTLMFLIFITTVIALFTFDDKRREAREEQKRLQALKEHRNREDAAKHEERIDEIRLANWNKRHPLGPLSEADYAELYRLVHDLIASYETTCRTCSRPIIAEHVHSIERELIRDRD